MTIENKVIYNLYKKCQRHENARLYIEGHKGGVTLYVTDGCAIYRQEILGDNKSVYVNMVWFKDWTKTGTTDVSKLDKASESELRTFNHAKNYFERERFTAFSVTDEFRKAIKSVSMVTRGDYNRDIVISGKSGKIDIATWSTLEDTACWQLEGDYPLNGAIRINKKYLDIKNITELSFSKQDTRTVLHVKGEVEAVIMEKMMDCGDLKMFFETLGYEYYPPIVPIAEIEQPKTSENPKTVKPKKARKPIRRMPKTTQIIGDIAWIRKMTGTYFM